jgi:hypothetical protein
MMQKALLTASLVLAFAAPAAADRCSFELAYIHEELDTLDPSRVVRETVTDLMKQAQSERKAGNARACVAKLAAVKRILRLE